MYQRIKASKAVLQEGIDASIKKQGCEKHPEVYGWVHGARTQNPDGEIVVTGNGNYVGMKLRELAGDDRSQESFRKAFKATRLNITDDGKTVKLEMTVPSVRAKVPPRRNYVAA